MSRAPALRQHDDTTNADQIIVFHDVTWEDFERLLEIRGDRPVPRFTYLEGELVIMSPSKDHERIKSFIGHFLEAWCIDRDIEVTPFGSWTLKATNNDAAVKADECYVFGTEPRERPQLAIEVEWTRGGIDELQVYQKLGVDEVWLWRKGVIQAHVLTGGTFERSERSRLLPDLDLALVASMLRHDTLTQAGERFPKSARGELKRRHKHEGRLAAADSLLRFLVAHPSRLSNRHPLSPRR